MDNYQLFIINYQLIGDRIFNVNYQLFIINYQLIGDHIFNEKWTIDHG